VVDKALKKHASERFPSAHEMQLALRRVVDELEKVQLGVCRV